MAKIGEWFKGITFFIFVTLMFYFFWDNIFQNLLNFAGSFVGSSGGTYDTSYRIISTMSWISFVFLYIMVCPGFLLFSIINGANGEKETKPLELLKSVGIWALITPILVMVFMILSTLISAFSGNPGNLDTGSFAMFNSFSWLLGGITLIGMCAFPFYFALKGYNVLE